MEPLSETQRRALAARLTAAEGALHVLAAYAHLHPCRPPAASCLVDLVARFSTSCDALFGDYGLPMTLRDPRLAVAEQVGRLEAALEDLALPEALVGDRAARDLLADLHLTVAQLAREVQAE